MQQEDLGSELGVKLHLKQRDHDPIELSKCK